MSLAAALLGAVALSLAVGVSRSLGDESRYAIFGGFALCGVILAWAAAPRRATCSPPGFLLVPALAVALAWQNWRAGVTFAEIYENRTAMLRRDARLGLPVNALAERHVLFPVPGYAENFVLLYATGHKSLRGAGPARPLHTIPIPLPPGARLPAYSGFGPAPAFELTLSKPLALDLLRLEFNCPDSRYREVYRLELPDQTDDSAGVVSLWLVPGRRTMLFRVEGTLTRIVIRPQSQTPGLDLTRCEGIVYGPP